MAQTNIRGGQIQNGTVGRADLNVTTVGQSVIAKAIQGTNITLSSTGGDSGTGDVTISSPTVVSTDAGNQATIGSDSRIYVAPPAVLGFVTKSAAYTLTTSDSGKYFICSGGSWALTLPAPAAGLYYRVRNDMGISGTTGTITLTPTGGTIDGAASLALLPQQECTLYTDGTNWRTFERKREVIIGTQDTTASTASASVLLPVGYRYFELQFSGVAPVTSNDYLLGQLSVNGGSTWITTGYYIGFYLNPSGTTAAFEDDENAANFEITPRILTGYQGQCRLIVYPGTASIAPTYTFDSGSRNNTPIMCKWNGYGFMSTFGPANALKYSMSSGNISTAYVTVKGVV